MDGYGKHLRVNCVGDMICGFVDMICGYVMDMQSTYESIVLGPAAKEGRVFTSEEKTLRQNSSSFL